MQDRYTMHDLGAHFPNLTGHPLGRDEYMPVEECGDMLIMGLSLVHSLSPSCSTSLWSKLGAPKPVDLPNFNSPEISPFALPSPLETRNNIYGLDDAWIHLSRTAANKHARAWLSKTYPLWKQWTSYLTTYALEPANQLSTDDFAGPLKLHTNLALKGIIGIKAMSSLAAVMGEASEAKYYQIVSKVYISKWQDYGIARDGGRAKLAYDWYGSWTTLYSLFADAVLGFHPTLTGNKTNTNTVEAEAEAFGPQQNPLLSPASDQHHTNADDFIPDEIYITQSTWYPQAAQLYGLPLDSRHLYSKLDWAFQSAAVAQPSTRKIILESVARWINESSIVDRPLTDLYHTEDGGGWPRGGPRFFARPVVGSVFAFLALGGSE